MTSFDLLGNVVIEYIPYIPSDIILQSVESPGDGVVNVASLFEALPRRAHLVCALHGLDSHNIAVGRCLSGAVEVCAASCVATIATSSGVGLQLCFGSQSHPTCLRGRRSSLYLSGVEAAEEVPLR